MKKIIRLTESDLHRIVKETVNKILEGVPDPSDYIRTDEPGNDIEDDEDYWALRSFVRSGKKAVKK